MRSRLRLYGVSKISNSTTSSTFLGLGYFNETTIEIWEAHFFRGALYYTLNNNAKGHKGEFI